MGDIKEAIKKVMTESHSSKELKEMGMWDFEKKAFQPASALKMTYDSSSTQLEPIYYWLLDFMGNFARSGIEKVTDNFMSSPGSGHFADMSQRESRLRQEAMNTLGAINQVIKSVIQLLYDLKEFEQRLASYEDANSKDNERKQAGIMAVKQIWLDNVDMKRGNTGIKAMAFSQAPFATLIDAFMIVNNSKEAEKLDLNDRVKRLLKQRIEEFNNWRELSEKELKKRFEIQKSYLRSQVETLKLYSAWVRPYLKYAEQLRMKGFDTNPSMVNAFSTTMFELVLFGKSKIDFTEAVKSKKLPSGFSSYKLKRDYFSCYLISFIFRGHVAQKVTQRGDYGFGIGGRVDVAFDSFTLNSQEMDLIKKQMEMQDVSDSLNFASNATDESLKQLTEDIEHFLGDKKKAEEKKEKSEDINPFSALFSGITDLFKTKEKDKDEITNPKQLKKDTYVEKYLRKLASASAKDGLYKIYDVYKKAHGMASAPDEGFDK